MQCVTGPGFHRADTVVGELKANKYPGKQIIPQGELSQQFKEKVLHFHGVVQWPLELRPELSENECAG